MIALLKNHRTIRNYTDEIISEELLNEIVEAGVRVSTTGNMQLYSLVVSKDPEKKKKLAPYHFNQPMIVNAPVVLTVCADYNRFKRWCVLNDAQPGYDNFLSFITASVDAVLLAQNICIAAESKGLGICYLGTTIYNAKEIIDELKLPKGVVPVTTITLGWPDEKPAQIDRIPIEAIMHSEEYHDYNDDDIKKFYSDKENREDSKQFVLENNKKSLAQVFTDVRYKKEDNEFFSKKLLDVIKEQGFLD